MLELFKKESKLQFSIIISGLKLKYTTFITVFGFVFKIRVLHKKIHSLYVYNFLIPNALGEYTILHLKQYMV